MKKGKVTLRKREVIEIFNALYKCQVKDAVLDHCITRNLKTLKSVIQDYEDDRIDLLVSFAVEKEGVLLKDERGDFQFSKEGQRKAKEALADLNNEEVVLELLQISCDENEVAKTLPSGFKSMLLDVILID